MVGKDISYVFFKQKYNLNQRKTGLKEDLGSNLQSICKKDPSIWPRLHNAIMTQISANELYYHIDPITTVQFEIFNQKRNTNIQVQPKH